MPRRSRIDAPGALHHIIARGIERRAIFRDDQDRADFLERLGANLEESRTPCFAWALLSNHIHLLLRTGATPISTLMRRVLTGYAVGYNQRHRRQGHLFQKVPSTHGGLLLLNMSIYTHLFYIKKRPQVKNIVGA